MIRTEFEIWRDEISPAKRRPSFALGWVISRVLICIAIGGAIRFALYVASWVGERF